MQLADVSRISGALFQYATAYSIYPDVRSATRYPITASAEIEGDSGTHVGLVRDVSARGLFAYSNFRPSCGDELQLQIQIWSLGAEHIAITCSGKVVRVVQSATGGATGIAISISSYQLRLGNAETPN